MGRFPSTTESLFLSLQVSQSHLMHAFASQKVIHPQVIENYLLKAGIFYFSNTRRISLKIVILSSWLIQTQCMTSRSEHDYNTTTRGYVITLKTITLQKFFYSSKYMDRFCPNRSYLSTYLILDGPPQAQLLMQSALQLCC